MTQLKLEQYEAALEEEGYDGLQHLCAADAEDIDELLKKLVEGEVKMKGPHAKTFKKAWEKLPKA